MACIKQIAEKENNSEMIEPIEEYIDDEVRFYLNTIGKIPLLTAEEEIELSKEIQKGNKEAINKLAEANLRFVVSIAKRFSYYGVPLMELIQEGNLGLIRAAEKFDYKKGYRFSTYSAFWVEKMIRNYLISQMRPELTDYKNARINSLNRFVKKYIREYGCEPSDIEIAKALHYTPVDVYELKKLNNFTVSLEKTFDSEEKGCLLDIVENEKSINPETVVLNHSLKEDLYGVMDSLTEKERIVLIERFGLKDGREKTLDEVAKIVHLSIEGVRQSEKKALRKLRQPSKAKKIKDYYGMDSSSVKDFRKEKLNLIKAGVFNIIYTYYNKVLSKEEIQRLINQIVVNDKVSTLEYARSVERVILKGIDLTKTKVVFGR